jgi:hypothetical protein
MKLTRLISAVLIVVLLLSTLAVLPTPSMAQQQLPDLVVPNAWQADSQIWYNLRNIGQGTVGSAGAPLSYYSALFIDGKRVAEDQVTTSLAPGQQLDRSFSYQWQPTPGKHTIMVCADSRQNIKESNEQNNCWEGLWAIEEEKLPDLIVEKIECRTDSKLWVTVKNIGSGAIPSGWKALGEVYFAGIKKGNFDLTYPTSTLNGGIENPDGSSTYFTNWDVTAEVRVRVVVDFTNEIKESNEQNNSREEIISPVVRKLPDLVIVEIICDRENGRIGYVIKNIGEELAKAGHATTLYVDGKEVTHDSVGVDLKPLETHELWFKEYKWPECKTIKVRVCADNYNQVEESNEQNNCLEKTCECVVTDIIPPRIISGPTTSQVTQSSVVICWGTDENSDSLVRYDSSAGIYGNVVEDADLVKQHCLTLTKLEPAITFHFIVESKDSSGNKVRSRDLSFETLSPPDVENPNVSLIIPDKLSGRVPLMADAKDNIGVDRIAFLLDGKPMHADYVPPFEWNLDTRGLDDGLHSITAQLFDIAGNMAVGTWDAPVQNRFPAGLSPVHVHIIYPHNMEELYANRTIQMQIEVTHDFGDRIKYIECIVEENGEEDTLWESRYCRVLLGEMVCEGETPLTETFSTLRGIGAGLHEIRVIAYDEHDNPGSSSVRVNGTEPPVPPEPTPDVTPSLSVLRRDNYFLVKLTVDNTGSGGLIDLTGMEITINNTGFQNLGDISVTERSGGVVAFGPYRDRATSVYLQDEKLAQIKVEQGRLDWDEQIETEYILVPVLLQDFDSYIIASDISVSYWYNGRRYSQQFTDLGWSSSTEVDNAFRSADYLIITNPAALFRHNTNHDDVNRLLCLMAELAKEKQGVLGYSTYEDISPDYLKSLINKGGEWSNKLCHSWTDNGYLLIVGETEIIPSWTKTSKQDYGPDHVHNTDYPYASTSGSELRPELCIGRIIGNDAVKLMKPIEASLQVWHRQAEFHRNDHPSANAYAIAGGKEHKKIHWRAIKKISEELDDEFDVFKDRAYEGALPMDNFVKHEVDTDVTVYFGHGYDNGVGWDWGRDPDLTTSTIDDYGISFGNTNPFIFAIACNAGDYAGVTGIAEKFFEKGAAVYIGSTEISYEHKNKKCGIKFFEKWCGEESKSIGKAWKETRRWAAGEGKWKQYWSQEYQLYGDPKYGIWMLGE